MREFVAVALVGLIVLIILSLYAAWIRFLHFIFWYKGPGSPIFFKSIETNGRVQKIFFKVCESAVNKGFVFKQPLIMATKWYIRPLSFRGLAYAPGHIIVISGYALKRLSDSDLSVLIAHELGHSIDLQTLRKGHPFFTSEMRALDNELFAWTIAAYLTSSEAVRNYMINKNES